MSRKRIQELQEQLDKLRARHTAEVLTRNGLRLESAVLGLLGACSFRVLVDGACVQTKQSQSHEMRADELAQKLKVACCVCCVLASERFAAERC